MEDLKLGCEVLRPGGGGYDMMNAVRPYVCEGVDLRGRTPKLLCDARSCGVLLGLEDWCDSQQSATAA